MDWRRSDLPPLNEAQFFAWQELLESRTGMYIPYERRSLLQSSLTIRMREIDCANYDEYLAKVQKIPQGVMEWTILVDRIMVRETRFFRNTESLDLVRRFLQQRVLQKPEGQPLNIWSVGCCSGEEPYSLAIACEEVFLGLQRKPVYAVSGTDISMTSLQMAKAGNYKKRQMSNMKPEWIERHFDQLNDDEFMVKDAIKSHVCFSMSNIVEIDKNPLRQLDVIFCQNVLVYFRQALKHKVLDSLAQRLAPGGLLVIAQGETSHWNNELLEKVDDNLTQAFVRHERSLINHLTH